LGDPVKLSLDGAPAIGPASAPLTLVEFSDFQCPYCILATPELHAILKAYPTQVRWIFKQFPLDIHSQAALAARAAVAAQKQAKFWEMHDALFAQKGRLSPEVIKGAAQQAGLDMARFDADMKADEVANAVTRDAADGERAGVMGTPTLFINGRRYNGPLTARALKPVIDSQLGIPTKAAATR
jgi:protein-disulfide isomerase